MIMGQMPSKCLGCGRACLEKIDFLSGMTEEAVSTLISESVRKTYRQGEMIFRESEPVRAIYLLHTGRVKLTRWDGDGREQIVGIFSRGDVIWESLFLEDGRYPYTAVCVEDTDLCQISRETVRRAIEKPEVACRIIDLLSRKLHDANERNRLLATQDPESRLAGFLLYRSGHGTSDTVNLRLDDIAGSISLRPETVSRKVKSLEQQGLVERSGQSRIRILDRERLKELYLGSEAMS